MPLSNIKYADKTDEELMRLVGFGDKAAFDGLYGRYYKKLWFFSYKILQYDREKAEDILHDIFIQVIEKPGQFDTSKKFSTWIFTLAKNACLNELRKQANRARLMDDAIKQTEVVYEPKYNNQIDAGFFSKEMNAVFDGLAEREQLLLTLRFQQELPVKEIAEILDCPEGTVKSGLYYLLKKIAEKIPHFNPNN